MSEEKKSRPQLTEAAKKKLIVPKGAIPTGWAGKPPPDPERWLALSEINKLKSQYGINERAIPEPGRMPNWEKLTGAEKDLWTRMPAFGESKTGKFIENLTSGKFFEILQAPSRWMQKPFGMAYMLRFDPKVREAVLPALFNDPEAKELLSATWETVKMFYGAMGPPATVTPWEYPKLVAGGWIPEEMTPEMLELQWQTFTNLAQILRGEATETGGLPFLIEAREAIMNGADPEELRRAQIERLGALGLRFQLAETLGLVVLDPLNFILPKLHPVEWAHGVRQVAQTMRVAPKVADTINDMRKAVDTLADVAKLAETGEDAVSVTAKILKNAEEISEDAAKAARAANKLAEAGKPIEEIIEALKPIDDILARFDDLKEMSWLERAIVALTGGDPLNPVVITKITDKVPKPLQWIVKLPTLTPSARAAEFMNTVANGARLLLKQTDDVADWVGTLKKAAAGAFGGTFGHMLVSPVGRHIQAALKHWANAGSDLLKVWHLTTKYRDELHTIARLIKSTPAEVLVRIQKGTKEAQVILDKLTDALKAVEGADMAVSNLAKLIGRGQYTLDDIIKIGEILKSTADKMVPFDKLTFRAALLKEITESAFEVARAQFGVKEMGVFQKAAETVKAAESLVLLGANPWYPIQNFFNNEITMAARGVFGLFPSGRIAAIWDDFGFVPPRLSEGFTIAGEEIAGALKDTSSSAMLRQFMLGEGKSSKAISFFKKLGSKDFRKLAAHVESMASQRAMTIGMMKAWRKTWVPGIGFVGLDDFSPGLAATVRQFDDELADLIMDVVQNAKRPEDIDAIQFLDDIRLNPQTLLRKTAEKFGLDPNRVPNVLTDEVTHAVSQRLAALGPRPAKEDIATAFRDIQGAVNQHIDDALEAAIPLQLEEFAAMAKTGGPQAVMDIYGQVSDSVYARQIAHARRLDQRIGEILTMEDPILMHQAWGAVLAEADTAWKRTWNFCEAAHRGVVKGLKASGMDVPAEYLAAFRGIRTEATSYIRMRNQLWKDFFTRLAGGKMDDAERAVAAAEIYQKLDDAYLGMIVKQDAGYAVMDDTFLRLFPEGDENLVSAAREMRVTLRELRARDMEDVAAFRRSIRGLPPEQKNYEWRVFQQERLVKQQQIAQMEKMGRAMLNGNEDLLALFLERAGLRRQYGEQFAGGFPDVSKLPLSQKIAIQEAWELLFRPEQRAVQRAVSALGQEAIGESAQEALRVIRELGPDVPYEEMVAAVEDAIRLSAGEQAPDIITTFRGLLEEQTRVAAERPSAFYMDAFNEMVGRQMYMGTGLDELWFEQGSALLVDMEQQAYAMLGKPGLKIANLPPDVQAKIMDYLNHVKGQLGDARFASVRMAEGMRDAALLNYSRQYHFDAYLGMVAPFEFWWTHSIMRWALHSLDRPAVLATYAKMKQFLDNVQGGYREGFPARLKGKIRIDLPWAPPEMGEIWADPFRAFGLPFEHFLQPWEQWTQFTSTIEKRAARQLDELLRNGDISSAEYEQAKRTKSGPVWDRAIGEAQAEDANLRFDIMDFMSLSTSPHVPLAWAWHAAHGRPEEIGPLPPERTLRTALGLMQHPSVAGIAQRIGIEPGTYNNVWGNVRKALGLPAFDQWDKYRIDRELSNMTAEGECSVDEAMRAKIDRVGRVFDEAMRRVEMTQGVSGATRLLGIPILSYPTGEEHQRSLYDEFYAALDQRDAGKPEVLTQFFDRHPEFETRLALWKNDEEQMQSFLVDNLWARWNSMPKLHQNQVKEQLGPLFQQAFIDKDTRSYGSIPLETMAAWLKLMGGEPPGSLDPGRHGIPPIEYAPPGIAHRAQKFYDTRKEFFPDYYDLQNMYFSLEKGSARRKFLREHPRLSTYWDWRKEWLLKNLDVAQYLVDDPDKMPKYESVEQMVEMMQMTPEELQAYLGPELYRIYAIDYLQNGEELPDIARRRLEALGINIE